jgi:predicted ArsR family transcriptional regulator
VIPGWLDELEEEIVPWLQDRGRISARDLAGALGVSESTAVHYICLLASEDRLVIEEVAVTPGHPDGMAKEARHGVVARVPLG